MTGKCRMKYTFMHLLALGTSVLLAGTAAAEEGRVSVSIQAGPYEIISTERGHDIVLEDFGRLPFPGKPDLPARIFAVAVPPGALVRDVVVEAGEGVVLPGTFRIAPVPLPAFQEGMDPAVRDREREMYGTNYKAAYGSDAPYPALRGEFMGQGGYRKYNLADVRIAPFAFRPESGKLIFYPDIGVHVYYSLPEVPPADTVTTDDLPRTEARARRIVCNYDRAQAWYPNSAGSSSRGLYDFVIITNDHLVDAVQPLVEWEEVKGRTVKVVTTYWIKSNYSGCDRAQKIRNFLRDKYPSGAWGIEDVLLVEEGQQKDVDDVPKRRTYPDSWIYTEPKPYTDWYYAELSLPDDQSWDSNNNGKWGEDSDNVDFYAEVNVGRIPWDDADSVEHICTKSVAFENNDDPTYKNNILFMAALFKTNPTTDGATIMETIINDLPWMSSWSKFRLYEDESVHYPLSDDLLIHHNVLDYWPAGKFAFVDWAGHGNSDMCRTLMPGAEFIHRDDCPQLNDDYPGIIFACACLNSNGKDNIGKNMLRQGAVGFLGATSFSRFMGQWQQWDDGDIQSFDYLFTKFVTSEDFTQEAAHQEALWQMHQYQLWTVHENFQRYEWGSLWGNPDLGLPAQSAIYLSLPNPDEIPGDYLPPGLVKQITVKVASVLEDLDPGSPALHYRSAPGLPFVTVGLLHLNGGLYRADLPVTQHGQEPEYYFSAESEQGTKVYLPLTAPDRVFSFEVCAVDSMIDMDFEDGPGDWTVENDPSLTKGGWACVDPMGTSDPDDFYQQPEDDHTVDGTLCFVTDKMGIFPNQEVDGGPTRLISETIDLSGGDAEISFYVWFYHSAGGASEPFEIEISNNDGSTWHPVESLLHFPRWDFKSYKVSDFLIPTDQVKFRFSVKDDNSDDIVEGLIDDFKVRRCHFDPTLWADKDVIPVSMDREVNFSLDAGAPNGQREYLLLGSVTGTYPITPLADGSALPLTWDWFTQYIVENLGSPMFVNFNGYLDQSGKASAAFHPTGFTDPSWVGQKIHFAYLLYPQPYFVSNPISLTFTP